MKTKLLLTSRLKFLIISLLIANSSFGQYNKLWDKTFGGSTEEYLYTINPTSDNGFLITGYTESPDNPTDDISDNARGGADYYIMKIDNLGNRLWDKRFGGSNDDYALYTYPTDDGGFLICGLSDSPISGDKTQGTRGSWDFWIIKVNSTGAIEWDQRYGGSGFDRLYTAVKTSDGGYLLGGESMSGVSGDKSQSNFGARDFWIIKINNLGVKQWDKTFGGTNDDVLKSIVSTADGGFLIGGESKSGATGNKADGNYDNTFSSNDYWIIKIDGVGVKEWEKSYGGTGNDVLRKIVTTPDGGFILGGSSSSGISGNKTVGGYGDLDYWILKIDATGNLVWDKAFGGTSKDELDALVLLNQERFLITGNSQSISSGNKVATNNGGADFWIITTDGSGNKLSESLYGGAAEDFPFEAVATSDGNLLFGGSSNSNISGDKSEASKGLYDYWIVKAEGNFRYSIVNNGNWNDGATWSFTSGGPPCNIPPDENSEVFIENGYNVLINSAGKAKNLEVFTGGALNWTGNASLDFYNTQLIKVHNGGKIDGSGLAGALINIHSGTNIDIVVNDSGTGLSIGELDFNAAATYTFSGSGKIHFIDDLDINESCIVKNEFIGSFHIGDDFRLDHSDISFTNNKTIEVLGDIYTQFSTSTNISLVNNGNMHITGDIDMTNSDLVLYNNGTLSMRAFVNIDAGSSIYNQANTTWNYNGATFDPDIKLYCNYSGSTFNYSGNIDQDIIKPQDAYYHLILSNTGVKTALATPLHIKGNLNVLDQASFNPDTHDVHTYVGGNWTITSTVANAFQEGTRTVTFNGTGDQRINRNELFHNWIIDKPSGSVLLDANISRVKGHLTFIKGIIEPGTSGTVIFETGSTTSGASDASFVNGKVDKIGSGDFVFPVGNNGRYNPIAILGLSSSGTFVAQYFNINPNSTYNVSSRETTLTGISTCEYWSLDQTAGTASAGVTLGWKSGSCGILDPANMRVARWDGTKWTSNGNGGSTGNSTEGTVTSAAAVTSFGVFGLGSLSTPPAGCGGTDISGNPSSAGLYTEFYNQYFNDNHTFFTTKTPESTHIEGSLNFNDNFNYITYEYFSVRYRGSLQISTPGVYTFYLTSDDAAFLWIGNAALDLPAQTSKAFINNGRIHGSRTIERKLYLNAGFHNLLIHFGNNAINRIIKLEYSGPGIAKQVLPSSAFCSSLQSSVSGVPVSITYPTNSITTVAGIPVNSGSPTINNGGSAITDYVITNTSNLPGGITIDGNGVISVNATVPAGNYIVSVALTNANGTTVFNQVYSISVLPAPPAGCIGTDLAGNSPAGGFFSEFYTGYFNNDANFFVGKTPDITRIDPTLNFASNFNFSSPTLTGSNPSNFSGRFRSKIYIATAGTYTFYMASDDASYVWIDQPAFEVPADNSKAIMSVVGTSTGTGGVQNRQVSVNLTAGWHYLLIHYGQATSGSNLKFEYEGPGVTRKVVPSSVLCTSQAQPPVATNDSYSTSEDTPLSVVVASGVLVNDSDAEGAPLTAVLGNNPANGTVVLNGDGSFTYQPNSNFNGSDSFTYYANDGIFNSATAASVTITINAINDAPVFTKGADQIINENADSQSISNWATGISDGDPELTQTVNFIVTNNNNALFDIQPSISNTGILTYTPAANVNGSALVSIVLQDNGSGVAPNVNISAPQTFSILVNSINNPPVFTKGVDQVIDEDAGAQTISGWATGINDGDPELNQQVTFIVSSTNSSLFAVAPAISPTGTLTFTPASNANGMATVSVQLMDDGTALPPNSNISAIQTVTITIHPVNDAPVALNDSKTINEDETSPLYLLENDTDVDNDLLNVKRILSNPAHGSITFSANDVVYTPHANYNGTDEFTYEVCDNGSPSLCSSATVNIVVISINNAPIAVNDNYSGEALNPIAGNVLENDSDIENDALNISAVLSKTPSNGIVSINSDGSFIYTPNNGFFGNDEFIYEVCDNGAPSACSSASVILNIAGYEKKILVSQGFSPNGDLFNNFWAIHMIENYPNNRVQVFNRSGALVFDIKGYNNENKIWEGSSNRGASSGKLADGTYFYLIDLGDGSKPYSGYVVLKN